jgi:hypothetical protein
MTRLAGLVLCALLAAGGCSLDPRRDELGSSDRGNGPLHRAGQPCLVCHSFALAGTVYRHADDADGLSGASVDVTDGAGHQFSALTNEVGNFYVEVRAGSSGGGGRRGGTNIPWELVFPLQLKVHLGSVEKTMRTPAQRAGSCAECHSEASAESVAKVFLLEAGE